jgi:hypothetical protein
MHKLCQARGPQEKAILREGRKTTPDGKTIGQHDGMQRFLGKDGDNKNHGVEIKSEVFLLFEPHLNSLRTSVS